MNCLTLSSLSKERQVIGAVSVSKTGGLEDQSVTANLFWLKSDPVSVKPPVSAKSQSFAGDVAK